MEGIRRRAAKEDELLRRKAAAGASEKERESLLIQARSVKLAQKRVESTNLFLEAGRAQIRDLLEAQEALLSAQNALTAAIINYRVAELQLQRDMGVLKISEKGLWQEYSPGEKQDVKK